MTTFISTKLVAVLLLFALFAQGLGGVACGTGKDPNYPRLCDTVRCAAGEICQTPGKTKQRAGGCQIVTAHVCMPKPTLTPSASPGYQGISM